MMCGIIREWMITDFCKLYINGLMGNLGKYTDVLSFWESIVDLLYTLCLTQCKHL